MGQKTFFISYFAALTVMGPRLIKPYLLIICLWGIILPLYGQVSDISREELLQIQNALDFNKAIGAKRIPGSLPLPEYNSEVKSQLPVMANVDISGRTQSANCVDSSFFKVFETPGRSYVFFCSAKTKDGGIILAGYGRNHLEGSPYTWYGAVTKFDSAGHHIWSKEIRSDVKPGQALVAESIFELSDGSFIVTGTHTNPLSTEPGNINEDFFAAKITSTGGLIWYKTFHSLMENGCTSSNIRYVSVAEGLNGDLFLGGTIPNCPFPTHLVVFKLNSMGNILWKYSFGRDVYCIGIFFNGSYITVINRSPGVGEGAIGVDLLRLNENTGAFVSHKSWQPDLPDPANFYAGLLNWTSQAIRLNNGNYCVFGQTFGDYTTPTVADRPHLSVLEFDENYNYVKGYTINTSLSSNPYESKIKVDRYGRVVYSFTVWLNDYLNKMKYYGSADNGVIIHQRKKGIYNLEIFYDNAELFDDGSYVFINNIATDGQANFFLYYYLFHNSDTSSQCMGLADNFSYTSPINYISYDFTWDNINPNPLVATNNQNNSTPSVMYTDSPPCSEKAVCDTVKIHGNAASCNILQDFTFTAFKNVQCGSRVNWVLDPTVVQYFQNVNDTTLLIRFNQSWQGWLHAEIITSCGKIKDSLFLTITGSTGPVNLGPDVVICPSNSIVLNARKGYASYQWNDGSVDSVLTVNAPGIYYVAVTDGCGNLFSDTVTILPAPPIPFDIGLDRAKCNNDTLHLSAPGGFLNYSWGPAYSINSLTAQYVIVQPAIDTVYFVQAEKTPGCFAYDTIRITVNTSPPIQLGADKSFCQGDSAVLNAGDDFVQYQWNTGSLSQQVTVHTAASYSVIATTAAGCRSYDTLSVINVWINPIVTLDSNPDLCAGNTRVLNAGNFDSYLWHNGTTVSSFTVAGTGTYYVTVWDNHLCKASDTVYITRILPLPSNFLPLDTSICNYGSLLIKPTGNFTSYLWNNASPSPTLNVSVPGMYWLQVTDGNHCSSRDSILVSPKDCLKGFHIPTAFTPDRNGLNDDFKPFIGGVVKQYQFTIYNRWGQVVFISRDLPKGWDGTFKGALQDSNVFAWICSYQLEGETVKMEKGTVVVIR